MGRYSSVLSTLIERIQAHTETGGLLDGFTFDPLPSEIIVGVKDMPQIRLFLPDIAETLHTNAIVDGTFTIKLTISTDRKLGVVAFIEAAETVMDALEKTSERVSDLCLLNTLARPFTVTLSDPFGTDVSLNANLIISTMPKPVARASRLG